MSHVPDAATRPAHTADLVDVALISWPSDEATRRELAEAGMPRILLIDADDDPPAEWDRLEDYVRLPVSSVDLAARQATVRERWQALR